MIVITELSFFRWRMIVWDSFSASLMDLLLTTPFMLIHVIVFPRFLFALKLLWQITKHNTRTLHLNEDHLYRTSELTNEIYDSKCQKVLLDSCWHALQDLYHWIALAILIVTWYRYKRLQSLVASTKLSPFSLLLVEIKNEQTSLIDQAKNLDPEYYVTQVSEAISKELIGLLWDIPLIPLVIVIIMLSPWNVVAIVRLVFWNPQESDHEKFGKILEMLVKAVLDRIAVLALVLDLLAFWRWNYLLKAIYCILAGSPLHLPDQKESQVFPDISSGLQKLAWTTTQSVIGDLRYIPISLINFLVFWNLHHLYRDLKGSESHEFSKHRQIIVNNAMIPLLNFLSLLLAAVNILLFTRRTLVISIMTSKFPYLDANAPRADCIPIASSLYLFAVL